MVHRRVVRFASATSSLAERGRHTPRSLLYDIDDIDNHTTDSDSNCTNIHDSYSCAHSHNVNHGAISSQPLGRPGAQRLPGKGAHKMKVHGTGIGPYCVELRLFAIAKSCFFPACINLYRRSTTSPRSTPFSERAT